VENIKADKFWMFIPKLPRKKRRRKKKPKNLDKFKFVDFYNFE
jgi:hypothetical protein